MTQPDAAATDGPPDDALARLSFPRYMLRRKFLKIFGGAFHIYDPDDNVVLYSKMKAFRFREDIRLYTDESKSQELLRIRTKSVLDISGAYDVEDSIDGSRVGALKRAGIKSTFLRDEWTILGPDGKDLGKIKEDSQFKAIVRRFVDDLAWLMPQKFHAEVGGREVATYQQRFNPIVQKIDIDFSMDDEGRLDPRLGLAAAVLLCAIEGRQG